MVSPTKINPRRFTGLIFTGLHFSSAVLIIFLLLSSPAPVCFSASIEPVNGGPILTGESAGPESTFFQGPLRVMTLNMAHGRKTAFSQIFLSWQEIHANLMDIGSILKLRDADIVALQEADGPSWWSGNFDHVALLAQTAGYPWFARAGYMDALALDYGAALLARRPFAETRAHRFKKRFLLPPKGFLLGRFGWYPQHVTRGKPLFIDIVSVHLDFSRPAVRSRQIAEMRTVLADRHNPLIILGDFNSDWLADVSVVRELTRQSGLQVYRPDAVDLKTYGDRRLDWILISADLEFLMYAVVPDILSDHLGVTAVIGFKGLKPKDSSDRGFQGASEKLAGHTP